MGGMGRLGNNLAGHYKRGVGMALQIGIGNFGGAIASNIYRTQDAPRYVLGRAYLFLLVFLDISNTKGTPAVDGIELMFVGIGFIALPIVVLAYVRINARRDAAVKEAEEKGIKLSPEQLRRLGDRAPDFRYTL